MLPSIALGGPGIDSETRELSKTMGVNIARHLEHLQGAHSHFIPDMIE